MLSKIQWGSLRNKIIIWAFVPTAIILITVALVNLYAYQRVTEGLVIERDREMTRLSARLLATELASYADPVSGQVMSIFDSGIVFFDENGKILSAEPETLEGWGDNWATRLPFRRMLGSDKPVFSDIVVDSRLGEKAIIVVVPIISREGQFIGGMAGLFRIESSSDNVLYRMVEKLRRGENTVIYLVDGTGLVLYHSNPAYIGADFADQSAVQLALSGHVGAFRTRDFAGQDIVASFAPIPDTSWGLVMEESWAELTRTSRLYGRALIGLLALGVIVPVLIVTFGVRRITRPIANLIDAARELAGGNLRQRITIPTGDELEKLADQFNLMAEQLQSLYDDLENRVADRTSELAMLNRLAGVVSRSLDLNEILHDALDEAMAVMNMPKGQAFLLDQDTQCLNLRAHRGLSSDLIDCTTQMPLGSSTSGIAAQQGRPVFRRIEDYIDTPLKTLLWREGLAMVVSVPLMVKGKTVGVIDLGANTFREISEDELSLLMAIGNQIGVAVENARLYEQAQQLAVVQERNRLARDLHDSVMQALYGVAMYAEAAVRQLELGQTEMTTDHLREIRNTAQESLREMRLLIFELRPPILKREGLAAALQARLESVEQRVGMQTRFQMDPEVQFAPEIEQDLYRVAQEALNNTLKHARATRVDVNLRAVDSHLELEIVDDGVGFDPASISECGGFGLRSMQERVTRLGGELTISSRPGQGTAIKVEVNQ
ncbi:MAG: GAF domain-containing protein [Anaerolineae bacterium]|nr:GAF domain-containing protein [Anaerolineae bacterium]